ncbi:MAG: alpha/beta fold hydrolase [Alphaproteobacteria bacterium]|jgi:homoserine O-acetyltransferase|nr:alpha/beta fold hydrolase [Alphaproteobacteria bacterium]
MVRSLMVLAAAVLLMATASANERKEGDYVARDFKFRSGETMAELRLHYTTLGSPKRDADGRVTNAVMILHGTGGSGQQFFRAQFADVLFAKGGLLDPAKYYIILPDGIGHGKSSKPSDGLRMGFPRYDYDDMVSAQHELLTKGLGVDRLRLIMGTSMGCMHAFVWGETHPDFASALMPLACLPVEIAGRNRMWRKMTIDAIMLDPDWVGGAYASQPQRGLRTAVSLLVIAGSAPIQMQKTYPTREAADKYVEQTMVERIADLDANDLLYQVAASRTYNPLPKLETIKAEVMWINSADDFINPPELGIAAREARRIDRGTFVLLPASEATRGHGSHTWAVLWQDYLAALLAATD